MELDRERGKRERQSANQAGSTSLVLGSWHEQASSSARSAVHSTPATIGDGRWPMPNSRLIKEGRRLGNYLHTKAASSAKGEK
jgi:hypothetical protein